MNPDVALVIGLASIPITAAVWHFAVRSYLGASVASALTSASFYVAVNFWRFGEVVASDALSFGIMAANAFVISLGVGIPFKRSRQPQVGAH